MKVLNLFRTGDNAMFTTESEGYLPDEVKVWFEWTTDGPDPLVPLRSVVIRPSMCLCPAAARRFHRRMKGTDGLDVKVIEGAEKPDAIDCFDEVLGAPRPPTSQWPRKEKS